MLAGGRIDEDVFRKGLGFAKEFVHGIHQTREEILSRHARRRGPDRGGNSVRIDILDFLGAALRALPDAAQGEPAARRLLGENAKAYVGLAESHIVDREDVFCGVERALSEDDDRMILSLFEAAEQRLGGAAPRHYAQLVDEIEAREKATEGTGRGGMSHEVS